MMRRDEMGHLKKDNKVFLEEEKERVQSEAEQDIAEVFFSCFFPDTITRRSLSPWF